ncbi:MAG: hypothetical protein PHE53_01030 [Thermoguttaceae bacterium]|nr:hypothetical protein [Thermoguttaceae bacterium]
MRRICSLVFISTACLVIPAAQAFPDIELLQGIEKLGIIGILSGVIFCLLVDRRQILTQCAERVEALESRMSQLESSIAKENETMILHLSQISETLSDIRDGQERNFSRMWEWGILRNPQEAA